MFCRHQNILESVQHVYVVPPPKLNILPLGKVPICKEAISMVSGGSSIKK